MADKGALQTYIDSNLSDTSGACYSIVCRGYTNESCVIPENVCIRFIDCLLTGVDAKGNNVVNFDTTNFSASGSGHFYFNNAAVSISGCMNTTADLNFNSSKVYVSDSGFSGGIYLDKNSYCKSHNNRYEGTGKKTIFSALNSSKIESYADIFNDYKGPVFISKGKSFIKLSNPKQMNNLGDGVNTIEVDSYSKLELYNLDRFIGQPNSPFASVLNNSSIKIYNLPTFSIKGDAFFIDESNCFLNNIKLFSIDNNFITANNSNIDIINTDTINAAGIVFDCSNSVLNMYGISNLIGYDIFKLTDTEITCVNKVDSTSSIQASNSVIDSDNNNVANKTKVHLSNIGSISGKDLFLLKNGSLRISGSNRISSTGNVLSSKYGGMNVIFDNIKSIDSKSAFITCNSPLNKIFINNVDTITTIDPSVSLVKSSIYFKHIKSIYSNSACINLDSCVSSFSDVESITGVTGKGLFLLSNVGASTLTLDSVKAINGGMTLIMGDGLVTAIGPTTINGDIFLNSIVGTFTNFIMSDDVYLNNANITFNNVNTLKNVSNISSILINNKCSIEDLTCSSNSVVTNQNSTIDGLIKSNRSVITNLVTTMSNSGESTIDDFSVFINYISNTDGFFNITESSFFGLSSFGNTYNLNKRSTIILGSSSSGNIINGKEGEFNSPVGAFIIGEGTLAISSVDTIVMNTNNMASTIRATYNITATTEFKVTVGSSFIDILPEEININAVDVYQNKV